jgi:hypothetical protein
MARQLEQAGKLDDWAQKAADRAVDESAASIENGMSPLEAQSEAKKNHLFLPAEEDMPELGADPNALPDPASLITAPGVIRRKKSAQRAQKQTPHDRIKFTVLGAVAEVDRSLILQTVPEQKSWHVFFDRHGCLYCHRKDRIHGGCGMCVRCYPRILNEKQAIIRELMEKS